MLRPFLFCTVGLLLQVAHAETINDFNEEALATQKAIEAASSGVIPDKFKGIITEEDLKIGESTEKRLQDYKIDPEIVDAAVAPTKQVHKRIVTNQSLGDQEDLGELASSLIGEEDPSAATASAPDGYEGVPEPKVLLFISTSMNEALLKDAFQMAAANSAETPTVLLLRGLIPGMRNVHRVMWHFHDLAKKAGLENPPSIYLDPESFTNYNITQVPVMVHRDVFLEQEVARLEGSVNIRYLAEEVERGKSGHMGRLGEVYEIAERNLIEEMQERASHIDWEEKRTNATKNFWHKRQDFVEFPTARKDSERLINPTVELTDDMRLPDGRIIARKGQRYNPLVIAPFDRQVFVFDATSPAQFTLVKQLKEQLNTSKLQLFITTHVDRDGGFEWMAAQEKELGAQLHILNKTLAASFRLQKIPAVVTDYGELLKVNEYAVNALESGTDVN